jgi:hypothetical protein
VRIYLILDVTAEADEPRRTYEQIVADLEPVIESPFDVMNDSSEASMHGIRVAGIGRTSADAAESARQRRSRT